MPVMRRRMVFNVVGAAAASASFGRASSAQTRIPGRTARVAFLSSASTADRPAYHAFRKQLRDLGWIEGQNLELAFHFVAGAGQSRLEPIARSIADSQVDAVLADGRVATLAIANVTRTIPIVSIMGLDPVALGLAQSLGRPGRNVTGMSVFSESLNTKRFQLLRDMVPGARRFGVIYGSAGGRPPVEPAITAAGALGLEMHPIEIRSLDDLAERLAAKDLEDLDAFLVGTDGFLDAVPVRVVQSVNRHNKPAIFPDKPYVHAGGLAAYGVDYTILFERLATMVDRVLRGERASEMPIQQPERFDLTLNQSRAREIGLAFSPLVLAQAGEIID